MKRILIIWLFLISGCGPVVASRPYLPQEKFPQFNRDYRFGLICNSGTLEARVVIKDPLGYPIRDIHLPGASRNRINGRHLPVCIPETLDEGRYRVEIYPFMVLERRSILGSARKTFARNRQFSSIYVDYDPADYYVQTQVHPLYGLTPYEGQYVGWLLRIHTGFIPRKLEGSTVDTITNLY